MLNGFGNLRMLTPIAVGTLIAMLGTGCGSRAPEATSQAPRLGPDDVLREMLAAYQELPTYHDEGVIRLTYFQGGRSYRDEAPLKVAAVAPNQIAVQAYHAQVVCDGDRFMARVRDEATNNIDGQVLVVPAPDRIRLEDLYRDEVLQTALTSGLGRQPPQLELLYADQPFAALFSDGVDCTLLAEDNFESHSCYRLAAQTPEGQFVFWIDQQSFLLRRLEYPAEALVPDLIAMPGVTQVQLVAEFRDAGTGPLASSHFVATIPPDTRPVRAFIPPPEPLPSEMFGQTPMDYEFLDPQGNKVDRPALLGQVAVLLWFNDHPACQLSAEQLALAATSWQGSEQVKFLMVCTEPSTRTTEQVQQTLAKWGVETPFVRDLAAHGRDQFQIPWAPTLVVLDQQGKVQLVEVGANPEMGQQLPVVIDRILAGHDLAGEILGRHQQALIDYEQMLVSFDASGENPGDAPVVAAAGPRLKAPREPSNAAVTVLWENQELSAPGNLCFTDADAAVWVLDGEQVVQLSVGTGAIVGRNPLSISEPARFIHATDSTERRFFVATGSVVHCFDSGWKELWSYPDSPELQKQGIADAQVVSVGDTWQLMVAFGGLAGVHAVSPDGQQLWSNASQPWSLSVAQQANEESARLLVAGQRGTIVPLTANGQPGTPLSVTGRAVFHLFSAVDRDSTRLCGLTYDNSGQLTILGLSPELAETWQHPVSHGAFKYPVRFVTSGVFFQKLHWVIAGPDGTIHLVRHDGEFQDDYALGQHIAGLACARAENESLILVATPDGVVAQRVSLRTALREETSD